MRAPRLVRDIYNYGSSFYGLQSADINGDGFTSSGYRERPAKMIFFDNALPL